MQSMPAMPFWPSFMAADVCRSDTDVVPIRFTKQRPRPTSGPMNRQPQGFQSVVAPKKQLTDAPSNYTHVGIYIYRNMYMYMHMYIPSLVVWIFLSPISVDFSKFLLTKMPPQVGGPQVSVLFHDEKVLQRFTLPQSHGVNRREHHQ